MIKKFKYLRIITVILIVIGAYLKFRESFFADGFLVVGACLGIFLATKNSFRKTNIKKWEVLDLIFFI